MELFHEDGHLTDTGLTAIVNSELSELESLEASEHLGFCSLCMDRYLARMEAVPLLQPETPLKISVMRRIGRKARRILFSRYATVAAAACLVLAMWGSGFASTFMGRLQSGPDKPGIAATQQSAATQGEFQPSLATRVSRAMMELPQNLFGFLSPNNEDREAAPNASGTDKAPASQQGAASNPASSQAP